MNNMGKILFIIVACLAFGSPARGQWVWQDTHGPSDQDTEYVFNSVSCSGYNCTAVGFSSSPFTNLEHLLLLRSNDGGMSWAEQPSGQPDQQYAFQNSWVSLVDQIDSLNVVAVGDSGLILRTTNAGQTWIQQLGLKTMARPNEISFSDSLNGIIVGSGPTMITTSDGGKHWDSIPNFTDEFLSSCHCFGKGQFAALKYAYGHLFKTSDNWSTIDSVSIPDLAGTGAVFSTIRFAGEDTIIAFGTVSGNNPAPLIERTTDGGAHWAIALDSAAGIYQGISCMSEIGHDTILAGSFVALDKYLMSTDNGVSWSIDSLIFQHSSDTQADYARAISRLPNGSFVAVFALLDLGEEGGYLLRSTTANASVESYVPIISNSQIYPSPATTSVTITTFGAGSTVHLLDILGREVLHEVVPANGQLTLDVSPLPPGTYYVSEGHTEVKFVKN